MSLRTLQQASPAFHFANVQVQRCGGVRISELRGVRAHLCKQRPNSVRSGTVRNDHHQKELRSTQSLEIFALGCECSRPLKVRNGPFRITFFKRTSTEHTFTRALV